MPTHAETEQRRVQLTEDNARDRRHAEYNLDRIYAALFRDVHPTQTTNLVKEGRSSYEYASAFS
jgi:hypothetical protein